MAITEQLQAVGPYQVDKCLHFNGTVGSFRCHERETNLPVAVHVVPRQLVTKEGAWPQFREEISRLLTLPASRVAIPMNIGEDSAHYWVAYEWINGRHLGQCVHDSGLPDVGQSLQMVVQTMEALGVLHERGIVHRMVTPNALFLNELQSVKLIQSGWGTFIMSGVEGWALNPDFMTRLPFLAPEVVRFGSGDERADVYSLGALLYFLLTGYPTLWADEPQQLVDLVFKGRIDFAPLKQVVPDEVSEVVEEMCSRDPEDRPGNFPALRDRLQYLASWYLSQSKLEVPTSEAMPLLADRQAVYSQASESQQPPLEPAPVPEPASPARIGVETVRTSKQANLRDAVAASAANIPVPAPAALPPVPVEKTAPRPAGQKMDKRVLVIIGVIGALGILLCAAAAVAYMLLLSGKKPAPKVSASAPAAATKTAPAPTTGAATAPAPGAPAPATDKTKYEATTRKLLKLGPLARVYFDRNGIWCMRLAEMKPLGAGDADLKDAWGNAFDLREDGFVVSAGRDGKIDSEDDFWYDGGTKKVEGWTPPAAPAATPAAPAKK